MQRVKLQVGLKRHHLYLRLFMWGIYGHLRVRNRWWHCKIAWWPQGTLAVSTRRQVKKHGRSRRYVRAYRFALSWWSTKNGGQQRPFNLGVMFYMGKSPK